MARRYHIRGGVFGLPDLSFTITEVGSPVEPKSPLDLRTEEIARDMLATGGIDRESAYLAARRKAEREAEEKRR